jgi:hypothetical protein
VETPAKALNPCWAGRAGIKKGHSLGDKPIEMVAVTEVFE